MARKNIFVVTVLFCVGSVGFGCCQAQNLTDRRKSATLPDQSQSAFIADKASTEPDKSVAESTDPNAKPTKFDVSDYRRTIYLIKLHHVKKDVDDAALFYGAVGGLVQGLNDPYSEFIPPEDAADFNIAMSGNLVGIGAVMGLKDGMPVIETPIEGSPAEKAGLRSGDIIIAVDGRPTHQMRIRDIAKLMRGKPGSTVALTIRRQGSKEPLTIKVVRAPISSKSVKWRKEKHDGRRLMIVAITQFQEDTAKQFSKAADEALATKVDGIIIDLRNNPGGILGIVKDITCNWLANGPVAHIAPRGEEETSLDCRNGGRLSKIPTVVLINRGSASASEIMAGALQDHGLARIFGETTWGKGCGQHIFTYPDGAMLKLTTFLWFTPKHKAIDKVGITPDEIVKYSSKDSAPDSQLERAIRFLVKEK